MGKKWQLEHPEQHRAYQRLYRVTNRRAALEAARQAANDRLPEDIAAAQTVVLAAGRFRESVRYGRVRRREDRNPAIQAQLDALAGVSRPIRAATGRAAYGMIPAGASVGLRAVARGLRREKASLRRMMV